MGPDFISLLVLINIKKELQGCNSLVAKSTEKVHIENKHVSLSQSHYMRFLQRSQWLYNVNIWRTKDSGNRKAGYAAIN